MLTLLRFFIRNYFYFVLHRDEDCMKSYAGASILEVVV